MTLFTAWVAAQKIPGLTCEVLSEPGRTPLIFIEIASTGGAGTVLMCALHGSRGAGFAMWCLQDGCHCRANSTRRPNCPPDGHLDKQPPLTSAWSEGLSPYTPVVRDGKLYGRGGADDGCVA